MPLTKIAAENFTVFEDIKIPFCEGLNVLVGENGVGKTHIMKLAYAACQASKHDVSFSQKNFDYPEKPLKYKHIRRISD